MTFSKVDRGAHMQSTPSNYFAIPKTTHANDHANQRDVYAENAASLFAANVRRTCARLQTKTHTKSGGALQLDVLWICPKVSVRSTSNTDGNDMCFSVLDEHGNFHHVRGEKTFDARETFRDGKTRGLPWTSLQCAYERAGHLGANEPNR